MTCKGEAHETLSLLFHRDGVPLTMVLDSSKELCEADCHPRQTKPYSLWQQAAEGCIRELKWGVSQKMIKTDLRGHNGTTTLSWKLLSAP